jgi:Ca2+-transporting ATPase
MSHAGLVTTAAAKSTAVLGPPAHTLSPQQALATLESTPQGLTAALAGQRLQTHGPNELAAAQRISAWGMLVQQFKNVLILILLAATAASAALGHTLEAVVITVIVIFAVLLGFAQEFRAEKAIDALRRMAAPAATLLRDGQEIRVPAREVVPGDILLLKAGDRVPADGRLLEAVNLQVEEAPLTGESVAVEKNVAVLPDHALNVGDRHNMVHMGTTITYGRGRAVVSGTAMESEFGRIARMLQTVEVGRTPLQDSLDKLGKQLARAALVIVGLVVALGVYRGQPLVEMLVFGIALAVAVVPEALPAVVTISLALGVQRMVKRNALMRRLPAVETLGGTTVICSDKTGTLTKDEMTVRQLRVAGRSWDVAGAGYEPVGAFTVDGAAAPPDPALLRLLQGAVLVNDAILQKDGKTGRWEMKGDPTEGSLVVAAQKAGVLKVDVEKTHPRVDEIPFTSETKRMATFHTMDGGTHGFLKGAPEVILGACTHWVTAEGDQPLDETQRAGLLAAAQDMAKNALRVLAVAHQKDATRESVTAGLTLLGLVGMIDPPRPEAKDAIQTCRDAGIRAVMITGDHPVTAEAVARELGLIQGGRVVTGAQLDGMDDAALARDIKGIDVFARVSPAHKLRVVEALQKNGEVVAMTGDGVNDAPALKKADIGVAMGIAGTDVSREAAAMTLTDDNFASIVAAVEEGRGIFENIRKFLMYLLSSNIGEIGLMAGTTLLGLPLPLSAVQILYVNLATDGLPALALAVDPNEHDIMRRPPRNSRNGIFTGPVVTLLVVGGVWSTLANVGIFWWSLQSGRSQSEAMTMTFVSLVLIQLLKAYNFRSDRVSILHKPFANKWLNLAVGWELLMLLALVYVPFLHNAFGTFYLPWQDWALVLGVAFTVVPVIELAKVLERKGLLGKVD